jgi:hypothetical protein
MSQTPSNNWAARSDLLAHALLAAREGALDISEEMSNIREICSDIMRDYQSHTGLDEAVGFDLDVLHFAKLEAATRALATKTAVGDLHDFEESMKRSGVGGPESLDNADWPDASNKSTFWCVHSYPLCLLFIPLFFPVAVL